MRWIWSSVREVFGLFVDDESFALLILLWLAVAGWVMPALGSLPRWRGPILFAGLAVLLVGSACRYARVAGRG